MCIIHLIINAGLYSGLGVTLIGVVPYMGLNFGVYEYMRQKYNAVVASDGIFNTSALKSMICGGISGGASKLAVYPLDTVKRKFQSQVLKNTFDEFSPFYKDKNLFGTDFVRYTSIRQCIKHIVVKEGFQGLYRVSSFNFNRMLFIIFPCSGSCSVFVESSFVYKLEFYVIRGNN